MTVQGGEKNPPTFPPSDAELSAAFRSAPWHISGKQHFPLSPSGTLTPHWQMCAVFGQSFTELSLSVWGCAQMTEMMQRRLSLRVDTRCSFRWRDSRRLTVKAWLFRSDLGTHGVTGWNSWGCVRPAVEWPWWCHHWVWSLSVGRDVMVDLRRT